MPIKITISGLQKQHALVAKLELELKVVQQDKAHAYQSLGDQWHDNPAFTELDQQEMKLTHDILTLKNLISSAEIIRPELRDKAKVSIGSKVTCTQEINDKTIDRTFEIVGYGESDPLSGRITYNSPVGKALLNKKPGEAVDIALSGKVISYKIVTVA